jgi:phage-related minor tail protein
MEYMDEWRKIHKAMEDAWHDLSIASERLSNATATIFTELETSLNNLYGLIDEAKPLTPDEMEE